MVKKLVKSMTSQKRVLDAAAKIFREYGYAGTTMRMIADEANLKAGSIYYHYESKDDLISAVLDLGMTSVMTNVKQALDALPPDVSERRRVEVGIYVHLSTIVEIGDYTLATRRLSEQVPEAVRARNMDQRDAYATLWQDILLQAQRAGVFRPDASITLARLFILGALNWTVEWYKPGRRSIADVASAFTSLVVDGLATPGWVAPPTVPAITETKPKPKRRSVGQFSHPGHPPGPVAPAPTSVRRRRPGSAP